MVHDQWYMITNPSYYGTLCGTSLPSALNSAEISVPLLSPVSSNTIGFEAGTYVFQDAIEFIVKAAGLPASAISSFIFLYSFS